MITISNKQFVKEQISTFESNDLSLVTYEGYSQIPYWHDDLKVAVILTLLESIDYKNYVETNAEDLPNNHYDKIIKAARVAFGRDMSY